MHLIAAGDGGTVTDPTSKLSGGAGGSVSSVTLSNSTDGHDIIITAGNAGTGGKAAGGSIEKITLGGDALGNISLATGNGSNATPGKNSPGGNGGSLKSISMAAASLESFNVATGSGGDAGGSHSGKGGNGGNAGALGKLSVGAVLGGLSITTGNGGDAFGGFGGGNAGSIESRSFLLADAADVRLTAGSGGAGWKATGSGGSIRDISLVASNDENLLGVIELTAGDGGSSYTLTSPNKTTLSIADGGEGGVIEDLAVAGKVAELHAIAGNGGNASGYFTNIIDPPSPFDYTVETKRALSGGSGGDISNLVATVAGESTVRAGDAGSSSNMPASNGKFGAGAVGGSVINTALSGLTKANISIEAGKGGASTTLSGTAGSIANLSLHGVDEGFESVLVKSGEGADGIRNGMSQNIAVSGGTAAPFPPSK